MIKQQRVNYMKIVILDGYTVNPGDLTWGELEQLGELIVYDRTQKNEVIERIGNAEAIFSNKVILDENIFAECRQLKYIGILATGYNNIDLAAAKKYGITVTNIPDYSTAAVAQFAIGLMLEICLNIGEHSTSVKDGEWCRSLDFSYFKTPLVELWGKTLGIVGMGKIGQATAKIAEAMGMEVIYSNGNRTKDVSYTNVELDYLFKNADIISLHCPLTEESKNLINKETIGKMKKNAIIINTSRGPVINEHDLAEALNNGRIQAAGVDVVSFEPIKEDNPLLKAKNCIITPHIAWSAKESRQRLMGIAINNLRQYMANTPINVIK